MNLAKDVKFNEDAKKTFVSGMEQLYKAVSITLGPLGRNVVIDKPFGNPHVTKDGVTVAMEFNLEDKFENVGVKMLKNAAIKTAEKAGDGTTTSTILAYYIVKAGLKMLEEGTNPIDLKNGISLAVQDIVEYLDSHALKIGIDYDKIKDVATISANNDSFIGELIAKGMSKLGEDGIMVVDNSNTLDTYVDVVEGMRVDSGMISPYFITDTQKMQTVFENPLIIMYDNKIMEMNELLPVLETSRKKGRPLLIIADDVSNEALSTLILNHVKGNIQVAAVRTPGMATQKMDLLRDIATLTGGTVVSKDSNKSLLNISAEDLGSAAKVIVTKDRTTIVNGSGDPTSIEQRISDLTEQMKNEKSEAMKQQLKGRIAKLGGGIAVLYVGATTEMELKEKKDRIDDAINATTAAIEEGIVPGGGIALYRISEIIGNQPSPSERTNGEALGYKLVLDAAKSCITQIAINSGKHFDLIKERIDGEFFNFGWNAKNDQFGDMLDMGIIDPSKVVRVALQNAASVAIMFLITECIMVSKEDPQLSKAK